MLVKELRPGALEGKNWIYYDSPAYRVEEDAIEAFDRTFAPRETTYRPSQEEFYILSHSSVE